MAAAVGEVSAEVRDDLRSGLVQGLDPEGGAGGLRVLIVQHEDPTPGGVVLDWLVEQGAEVEVHRIDLDDRRPDPARYDMIVSLGSELAAYDDAIPWIGPGEGPADRGSRRRRTDPGPLFSADSCWRGCSGGGSFRGKRSEVGWLKVKSRNKDLVPEGPWFQWHFDTFSLPPGAELLADSGAGPQAFSAGRSLGVQFHPEVNNEDHGRMGGRPTAHELDDEGVDPDRLLEETRRRAAALAGRRASPAGTVRRRDRRAGPCPAEATGPRRPGGSGRVSIEQAAAGVFRKHPGRDYPIVDRAEGVRLYTADGGRILDACSGGAMAAGLGHGVAEIVDAAASGAGGIGVLLRPSLHQPAPGAAGRAPDGVGAGDEQGPFPVRGFGSQRKPPCGLARQYHVDRGGRRRPVAGDSRPPRPTTAPPSGPWP